MHPYNSEKNYGEGNLSTDITPGLYWTLLTLVKRDGGDDDPLDAGGPVVTASEWVEVGLSTKPLLRSHHPQPEGSTADASESVKHHTNRQGPSLFSSRGLLDRTKARGHLSGET